MAVKERYFMLDNMMAVITILIMVVTILIMSVSAFFSPAKMNGEWSVQLTLGENKVPPDLRATSLNEGGCDI